MRLFDQGLTCPHCGTRFSAPVGPANSIVQRSHIFACPKCGNTFAQSEMKRLLALPSPWSIWKILLMVAGIMVILCMLVVAFLLVIFGPSLLDQYR